MFFFINTYDVVLIDFFETFRMFHPPSFIAYIPGLFYSALDFHFPHPVVCVYLCLNTPPNSALGLARDARQAVFKSSLKNNYEITSAIFRVRSNVELP